MTDASDRSIRQLCHDLSNPLAAILAEAQLLLLRADELDQETVGSLKEIEGLARRMRSIIQDTQAS